MHPETLKQKGKCSVLRVMVRGEKHWALEIGLKRVSLLHVVGQV